MCHDSKFLETSPLEHFYVVIKHVLKSAWVILRVLFENGWKTLILPKISRKLNNELLRVGRTASGYRHLIPYIMSSFIVISKLFACACNITVKQFNLNAKVTLFNPSMFCRFECQIFVTKCRFHTKAKQEVKNGLLRGLPIINLR